MRVSRERERWVGGPVCGELLAGEDETIHSLEHLVGICEGQEKIEREGSQP
jgi:hypothetical protein